MVRRPVLREAAVCEISSEERMGRECERGRERDL